MSTADESNRDGRDREVSALRGKDAERPSVLDKITAESRKRAAVLPTRSTQPEINTIDFAAALKRRGTMPQLIAELKRKSPSKGTLKAGLPVVDAVELYAPYAAALSILTEPMHFMGSIDDLAEARRLTDLPLLRKDFIVDTTQIDEARLAGASSFLLIAASLTDAQLAAFIAHGRSLGMEPLVEVLTEEELRRCLNLDVKILGINNRNLHTLEIDMNRCIDLAGKIPAAKRSELILVAESGYGSHFDDIPVGANPETSMSQRTRAQLLALPEYFDAVLMGTGFMQEKDPAAKLKEVFG